MAKYPAGSLDAVFSALADPTRRAMAERLRVGGEASVSELAEPFGVSLPTITRHLGVLEHAGLVEHYKAGRVRHVRLAPAPLQSAEAFIARYRVFWAERFAGLGEHLSSERP